MWLGGCGYLCERNRVGMGRIDGDGVLPYYQRVLFQRRFYGGFGDAMRLSAIWSIRTMAKSRSIVALVSLFFGGFSVV